jgi:hypothetical protein
MVQRDALATPHASGRSVRRASQEGLFRAGPADPAGSGLVADLLDQWTGLFGPQEPDGSVTEVGSRAKDQW